MNDNEKGVDSQEFNWLSQINVQIKVLEGHKVVSITATISLQNAI